MQRYRLIAKKGEGTFSEVLKAQNIRNQEYCAIKCMKNHFDSIEQVNNLREIQALQRLSPHPHVVTLFEVLYDRPSGRLALVFELMQMNFYELIRGRRHYLAESTLKNYIYQLCKAMTHMHRHGIFHRDIKPENVLISSEQLKVADFGSCRGIYSRQPYTEYISTRWYRAPECLLTDGYYSHEMDMWGVGCVMFEVASLFPLFPGTNEMDQIQKIHKILGTPSQSMLEKFKISRAHENMKFPEFRGSGIVPLLPNLSPGGVDLVVRLLEYDPKERMTARAALRHRWFADQLGDQSTVPVGSTANKKAAKTKSSVTKSSSKKHGQWKSDPSKQSKNNGNGADGGVDTAETGCAAESGGQGGGGTSYSLLPDIHAGKKGPKQVIEQVKKTVAAKQKKKKSGIGGGNAGASNNSGGGGGGGGGDLPSIDKPTLSIKGHGPLSQQKGKPSKAVGTGSRLLGQASIRSQLHKQQAAAEAGVKKRPPKLKKARTKKM